MINDATWSQLKSLFLEVLGWARETMLFDLSLNNTTIHLSIFDFLLGMVAFTMILDVIWSVLHSGGGSDD
jgi:hypothetical protein